jgi:hypothetical protein
LINEISKSNAAPLGDQPPEELVTSQKMLVTLRNINKERIKIKKEPPVGVLRTEFPGGTLRECEEE